MKALVFLLLPLTAAAELRVNSLFTDHMVLQRDQPIRVWGWDAPGKPITVSIGGQSASSKAGEGDGRWQVELPARPASAKPIELKIVGSSTKVIRDVLVGEVWICSGQSNMQWPIERSLDFDLELVRENQPLIRLIQVPTRGTQEIQNDFNGAWRIAGSADSVRGFSAVGYYFGRTIAEALGDVPIGLISCSWGGSAADAWIRRDLYEADERNKKNLEIWKKLEATVDQRSAEYARKLEEFKKLKAESEKNGKPFRQRPPADPQHQMRGQHRPGNLFAGMLHPLIGYGIRGTIWYQGESNAGRPEHYASLFPSLINHWREEWQQGDFPFYWVQLADFHAENGDPGADGGWARVRDSQTSTLSLPNTGQAVIIDSGEADDIHPPDKITVARRLARHALNKNYGFTKLACESPRYQSHRVDGNQLIVTFDTFGANLDTSDTRKIKGFAIAGKDGPWKWAEAKIINGNKVTLSHPEIANPVRARYAWSNNPVCNLQNQWGLPATPFTTNGGSEK
ncbi:MAG: sialate O-acetylesterase [Verrucomicrobiota bacterium]